MNVYSNILGMLIGLANIFVNGDIKSSFAGRRNSYHAKWGAERRLAFDNSTVRVNLRL
jgi:hypothetical protein